MAEPSSDKPQYPRPFSYELTNGTFVYPKNGVEPLSQGTILMVFTGEEGDWGPYGLLDPGTYYYQNLTIEVIEGGEADSVS